MFWWLFELCTNLQKKRILNKLMLPYVYVPSIEMINFKSIQCKKLDFDKTTR